MFEQLITPDDIASQLEPQLYESLTDGQEATANSAISSACIWATGIARRCGLPEDVQEPDVQNMLKLALVNRAIYNLYKRGDHEDDAQHKLIDAIHMMVSIFGDCARYTKSQDITFTGGSICHDRKRKNWAFDCPNWSAR